MVGYRRFFAALRFFAAFFAGLRFATFFFATFFAFFFAMVFAIRNCGLYVDPLMLERIHAQTFLCVLLREKNFLCEEKNACVDNLQKNF